jgi:hypothetical protein
MGSLMPTSKFSEGTCFGYGIRSELSLVYLRQGISGPPLQVREGSANREPEGEPTFEWDMRPRQDFLARLYVEDGRYSFWTDREGWFSIDADVPSITVPDTAPPPLREVRLWGIPAALCFSRRGDVSLHAAAVEVDGSALIFAAPGGFGKTTMAGAFLRAGHRVLAEDVSCFRISPDPVLLPGPAILRVRRDVYERLDFPGTYPIVMEPDRVHLAFDPDRRGEGLPVPIRGVVVLRAAQGPSIFERRSVAECLPDLWALAWKLPTDADRARTFQGTAALASTVPVWDLHRKLSFDRLDELVDEIVSTCLSP